MRAFRFLHHFRRQLRKAIAVSNLLADLDACNAIAAGLASKIAASESNALANAEALAAPKVATLLSTLQAVDASVTPAPAAGES